MNADSAVEPPLSPVAAGRRETRLDGFIADEIFVLSVFHLHSRRRRADFLPSTIVDLTADRRLLGLVDDGHGEEERAIDGAVVGELQGS